MRREGYEMTIGQPQVILHDVDGENHEPYESLVVDVPEEYASRVIDLATKEKGDLHIMETKGEMQHLEFEIPSRGLIGLRSQMLTATAGESIMAHRFTDYKPFKGAIRVEITAFWFLKRKLVLVQNILSQNYKIEVSFFVDPGEEIYTLDDYW